MSTWFDDTNTDDLDRLSVLQTRAITDGLFISALDPDGRLAEAGPFLIYDMHLDDMPRKPTVAEINLTWEGLERRFGTP
jgi:hypothetical protein